MRVTVHDFPDPALGKANPHGVYGLRQTRPDPAMDRIRL
ncbi:hypothetical protein ACQCSX_21065 (plasmid) [Pseudarthrobacter sp. P1]